MALKSNSYSREERQAAEKSARRMGRTECDYVPAEADAAMFSPMLADHAPKDLTKIKFPVLVSPKLDGVRCIVRGGRAVSRKLIEIPNRHVQSLLAGLPEGLDGELTLRDGGTFNEVQSAVMSEDGTPDVVFNVFDWTSKWDGVKMVCAADRTAYEVRYHDVRSLVLSERWPAVRVLEHEPIQNLEALLEYEREALEAGYEGVMLRSIDGPYKCGRSTRKEGYLLKLKRFEDAEAIIVGYVELMHNENEATKDNTGRTKRSSAKAGKTAGGTLGAFVCTDPFDTSRTFEIGTMKINAAGRRQLWEQRDSLIGAAFKFKYQPEPGGTHVHKPRCPVGLGVRDPRDMD